MPEPSVIVLGLGNLLLADEGLGIHAMRQLEQSFRHPNLTYCDGGTRGISLLPYVAEASHILFLDCIAADTAPGTVIEIKGRKLRVSRGVKISVHDVGLAELLTLLVWRNPKQRLHLIGMVPASLEWGTELSRCVGQKMPVMLRRAEKVLKGWLRRS
ncbi:MAG: hydrogenase maturation protease [Acidobacteria bacterium]|nr:hydrogenase maturation protease [Acidobacteriota bacterium]